MFPHLQPQFVDGASINNNQNDYDVFYFTLRASQRQGGSINEPQFSLGLAGLLGNTDIYDQNHIYIVPTFLTGQIYTPLLSCPLCDYAEVRVSPFQAQNENNKSGSPFVLLRLMAEVITKNTNKSYSHYDYNTFNRENNKGLRLPYGALNFDTITLSVNEVDGSVINFASTDTDQTSYLRDFILQFKIVCYKK